MSGLGALGRDLPRYSENDLHTIMQRLQSFKRANDSLFEQREADTRTIKNLEEKVKELEQELRCAVLLFFLLFGRMWCDSFLLG